VGTEYQFTPLSIAGRTIVASYVRAAYWDGDDPSPMTAGQPVDQAEAAIAGLGSRDVGGQPKGTTWLLTVELGDTTQAGLDYLAGLFDETAGLVYFRVTDGDGKVWRTTVRLLGPPQRVNPAVFKVPMRVADPRWQEDVATPDSQLNKQTSPITVNLTVAGTRLARPAFTFTADAAKALGLDDYEFSFEGFLVNRSPRQVIDWPVWLCDQAGAQARIATDLSATGATVKQTTGATTAAADIAAGAGTITLTSAANWPAAGLGFLTDSRGVGFHDQFYYTSIVGDVLQGVVWLGAAANGGSSNPGGALQTAGGIAHTAVQVTAIQPSGVMLSGDDVAVYLDGVPVERWLVGWNSAASDIVTNVHLPAARTLTTAAAMTAGSPAKGGSVSFRQDISWLAGQGFFVVDNEVFHYTGKSGRTVTGIRRALWGTTAATHAKGANAWAAPKHVVVGAGWAKAGTPYATDARRPACQLPGSSNQVVRYGDETDDGLSVFYDRDNPDRTTQWTPELATGDDALSAYTTLSGSGTAATFQDSGDDVAGLNVNSLSLRIAQKIANQAAEITYDAQLHPSLALDLYGTVSGKEMLLKELIGADASMTGRQVDGIAGIADRLRFGVRHATVVGIETGDYGTVVVTDVTAAAQVFILSGQTTVSRLAVRAQRNGSSGLTVNICRVNTDDTVDYTAKVIATQTVANGSLPVSMGWVYIDLSSSPVVLLPGKYALVFSASAVAGSVTLSRSNGSAYTSGEARAGVLNTVIQDIVADWDAWSDSTTITTTNPNHVQDNADIPAANQVTAIRFPLSGLVAGQALQNAQLRLTMTARQSGNFNAICGAYAASGTTSNYGQTDPSVDSAALLFAKAGFVSTRNYVQFSFGLNAPSTVTTALGVNGLADLKAAVPVGRFTVGVIPKYSDGVNIYNKAYLASIEDGVNPKPRLTLTYSEPLAAAFATKLNYDLGVKVYGSPLQADSPGGSAGQTAIGKCALYFDAAERVYVHRLGGFASSLLHLPGVLADATTGNTIALDVWMRPNGSTLSIDCEARTAVLVEDGVTYAATAYIEPSDKADWMPCPPGLNVITYTDASLLAPGQIDLVTTVRGVKV